MPLVSTVDKFAKGKYYRRADFIVAVSEAVASHCMGKGFPDVPVEVLPNSLDIARYRRASADGNGYPKRAGKDGNKAVILGAGRFVDWKGFDVLIRSAALVSRSRPVELWLAGTGPELERLEALAREEVAPVRFWGFVEDIRELMWASDIFVLPSRDPEPFGLVLLEAMACGLPVIATDRGGPLDMIEDGRNGWLVPPGDPDALSRTLTEALSDPDLARKGLESMRRAREFDFDTVADRQMKFYKEIMEGRGKAI
ncbi:MAG: hypothetical protein STSR0007_02460 [Thermovirga sp.]